MDNRFLELHDTALRDLKDRVAQALETDAATHHPHIERLLDGVAFLSSRIERKVEEDYPFLIRDILERLLPHLVQPFPAMAIVGVEGQTELRTLPAGTVLQLGDDPHGRHRGVEFQTTRPVTLWPLALEKIAIDPRPFTPPPGIVKARDSLAVLTLELQVTGTLDPTLSQADALELFFDTSSNRGGSLFHSLLADMQAMVLVAGTKVSDGDGLLALQTLPHTGETAILPIRSDSHPSLAGMAEFFAYPMAHRFLRMTGLGRAWLQAGSPDRFQLRFYLRDRLPDLEGRLKPDDIHLAAVPAINIVPRHAEPIRIVAGQRRYPIRLGGLSDDAQLLTVTSVLAVAPDGQRAPLPRLHAGDGHGPSWRLADVAGDQGRPMLQIDGVAPDTVLLPRILSHDGDRAAGLPFGKSAPSIRQPGGGESGWQWRCLSRPTRALPPNDIALSSWVLAGLLIGRHLPLAHPSGPEKGAETFRDLLERLIRPGMPDAAHWIGAIQGISGQMVSMRSNTHWTALPCRGLAITVTIDDGAYADGNALLFGTALSHFLAAYAPINSLTRLDMVSSANERTIHRWPALSGTGILP